MKIAVTGEGPTDYGKSDYKTNEWHWGPVAEYLKKIADEEEKEIELVAVERHEVEQYKLQQRSLKGLKGKAIPSRRFSVMIRQKEYVYGVYYCDADREAGTSNSDESVAKRHWKDRYEEVSTGLDSPDGKMIPMIPLRMIENWIMADQDAIEALFGKKSVKMRVPSKCELLWGDKRDPNSNYPKNYLQRFIRCLDKKYADFEADADCFTDIAKLQKTEILRKQCGVSFEVFYQDYRNLLRREVDERD